jgi:hypothetical protein
MILQGNLHADTLYSCQEGGTYALKACPAWMFFWYIRAAIIKKFPGGTAHPYFLEI